MFRFLLLCITIACVSLPSFSITEAAEIGCDLFYEGNPHRNEEGDKKLWPGGFRPVAGMCMAGFIRGTISKGDFDKVRDLYVKNHPLIYQFFLLSPGGDVTEALKIGALFRKYLIYAWAPIRFPEGGFYLPLAERAKCEIQASCRCVSACALIWLG